MPLTCTASDIAEAAKCFQNPCINENDRLAIGVLLKAYQLVTAGGTDYTDNLDALIADSVGLLNITIGMWTLSAEEVALLLDATSGSPTTVDTLLAAVACLRCQSLKVLRAAFMFLNCAINAEG
jgi:hypothetical protein